MMFGILKDVVKLELLYPEKMTVSSRYYYNFLTYLDRKKTLSSICLYKMSQNKDINHTNEKIWGYKYKARILLCFSVVYFIDLQRLLNHGIIEMN